MADADQERQARQAHVEKIEADTRKERAKAEQRTGIDKEVENELQTARREPTLRPGREGSGADGERG
jgi:hypothetical protein